jgi:hypothetical protein
MWIGPELQITMKMKNTKQRQKEETLDASQLRHQVPGKDKVAR